LTTILQAVFLQLGNLRLLKLLSAKLGVEISGPHKIVVPAALQYPAVLENQDLIRNLDGREPVRNHERRSARQGGCECLLDGSFCFGIKVGGGLVQDDQPGSL
jgi:hypothetical protein